MSATNPCGTTTFSKQVCVTAPPTPGFTVDNISGCAPLIVNATNTTVFTGCAQPVYNWTISYASSNCGTTGASGFTNGTSASSPNPSLLFTNPGTYTITLSVTNACGTYTTTKTIVVKRPPTVSISSIADACGTLTTTPSANITNCGSSALTYLWTFGGGSPATSTGASPGSVFFSGTGLHTITLAVTNECGTTTATQSFTIKPVPDINAPANQAFCPGSTAGPFNTTGSLSGTNYSWTNTNTSIGLGSSGNGATVPAFTTTNSGSGVLNGTITINASNSGCTNTASFTVAVNPKPAAPTAVTPINYCQNATAVPLSATALPGNTLNWYTTATGGTASATALTPSTSTVGSATYYVSQTNTATGCESNRTAITVTIHPVPFISSSSFTDPTSCASATGKILLNGLSNNTSYTVNYIKNSSPVSTTISSNSSGVLIITGLTSGTYTNITVTLNGCPSNVAGPFTLTDPNPPATPTASGNSAICSGTTLSLSSTAGPAGATYLWSGPNSFSSSLQNPSISNATVAASGTYFVTITLNSCTSAPGSVNVVVNPTPSTPATTSNSPLCSGSNLNLTASSTAGASYTWTGPNSFSSAQQNPSIPNATPSESGNYIVTATLGTCSSNATVPVTVKPTPVITASYTDPTNCASATGSIVLNGLTPSTTYTVNYTKNTTAVSVSLTSGISGSINISNLTAATYSGISVTLNGCPSNTVGPFTLVDPNPPATPTASSNTPLCSGSTLNLAANTTSAGTATWSWTGPNAFTNNGQNPSITNVSTAAGGNYTVTVSINGCTSSATIAVVVNPKPAKPVVVRPVFYCLNQTATALTGTASAGNTLAWYDNAALNNGTPTAIVPLTGTAGTLNYYVTQTSPAGCVSDTSIIPVTVYGAISNNVVGADQNLCSGNTPQSFTSSGTPAGGTGSFTYQWLVSTDFGNTWNIIAGANNAGYAPGALSSTTKYRRVVSSGPCLNDSSNIITVTIQGTLSNFDVSAAQTICSGTSPLMLSGQAPSGGNNSYVFQWQSSPDNTNWTDITGATQQDYQPPALTASVYYRRRVTSGPCSAFSSSVLITVNALPVMNPVNDVVYCNNASTAPISFSSSITNNVSCSWTNDNGGTGLALSGTGNIAPFTAVNNSNPKVPVTSNITVHGSFSNNSVTCPGASTTFRIITLPTIAINAIPDTVVCTGTSLPAYTPIHDAGVFTGTTVTYTWSVSGNGISLSNGSGPSIPAFTTLNAGSSDLVATITVTPKYNYAAKSCDGIPRSYTITVKSPTPGASAGPDTILCAATAYTMQANQSAGTTGLWSGIGSNAATIVTPSSPVTQITGLQPSNTYSFVWTVTGFASCPSTKDTVTIKVDSDIINTIDTATKTICSGQTVTVSHVQSTGGNGLNYSYQWQSSSDGVNYTNIAGETSASLSFTPPQSVYVRRMVTSLPCVNVSLPAHIIVQPPVTNNTISANQSICINTAPSPLQGSAPAGADGVYQYQWQSSPDGINWTDIAGSVAQNMNPPVLATSTKYRRIVRSNLCSGPQSSTSNVVTITVNPDAKAVFTQTHDIDCAPFVLNSSVIQLQTFPSANGSYQWFVDGNFIGSANGFPGYTIINNGDSVTIKLVAISAFGCKSDSIEHKFYTRVKPVPSFTVSDTVGCGPLSVSITNTTPNIGLFNYNWNFGNGQSSTLQQPGTVVFLPNPTFGDTTYSVKLTVVSPCDTILVTKSIRVKSKPKALFAPNASVGCSPMTVIFNNTSLGIGNTYTWNFGDGSASVTTGAAGNISHTFTTAVRDTFYVKLIALNECGKDSLTYAIVVSPNTIHLDFAVNGNQQSGCTPHTVSFINNSSGASAFTWNFGDNTIINTSLNIDTVTHSFLTSGTYVVTLHATNGCSDTTSTETIVVYPKPHAAFTASSHFACLGDTLHFTNASDSATSYLWQFGDNTTSAATNPVHAYTAPGIYTVKLVAFRFNAPGSVCSDTTSQQVQVVSSLPGAFTASDTIAYCAPFTITFTNQNLPSVTAVWNFGDNTSGSGNVVSHTFLQAGIYTVQLTVTVPGGCTYITSKTIKILGPVGTWTHTTGYVCNSNSASFQVLANNTDSLLFLFGDGQTLTTTNNLVFHTYANAGVYFPSVILKNNAGCLVTLPGMDSIKVEKIKAGFTATQQNQCGFTTVNFSDTSHSFFGKNLVNWNFGDNTTGSGINVSHSYSTTGTYPVQLIVFGNSGCSDTITRALTVAVNSKPAAAIVGDSTVCTKLPVVYNSSIQSSDAINIRQWNLSNGANGTGVAFTYTFTQTGNYSLQLIAGTVNGCYDTVVKNIRVNPTPTITASNDLNLCRGSAAPLTASGAGLVQYSWSPLSGLSCYNCANPIASPFVTTPYLVQGTNSFGCSAYDTVVVTVIQPLHLSVSSSDSICIGAATQLVASGATTYSWSPAIGLSNTTVSNPIASPSVTTVYRVVGYDGYNCFTDTAFVLVAVGAYPTVNLGPDIILPTGNLHPLNSNVQNGPITQWLWSPSTDLSCSTCPLPIANIKKDITYTVRVTTAYGCSASDTISIKAFCESAQVFIPNAFTPDGDGFNDVLMVRASGIALVKTFRVFNRWGEVVFEKSNFAPNNPAYGWDGKIKGVVGGPDVFVYTADVICDNGSSYTYKGNVSIIK